MTDMVCALVYDDKVQNVILIDDEFYPDFFHDMGIPWDLIDIEVMPEGCWLGWIRVNGLWINPNPPPPQEEPQYPTGQGE